MLYVKLVVHVILKDNVKRDVKPEVFYSSYVSTVKTIFGVFIKLTGNDFDFLNKKLSNL